MADAQISIPGQWREFRSLGLRNASGGPLYGAICAGAADRFEYLTGMQVDSFDGLSPEIGRMRIPAQRYAVFASDGHVSQVGAVWQHIWRDWLPQAAYEDAETPPFELYDARFNPETGEGGFEIWFPIREKRSPRKENS